MPRWKAPYSRRSPHGSYRAQALQAPFAAWFVQSTGLTGGIITFSHDGTSVAAGSEASKDGLFAVSINGGEDEARIERMKPA